MIAPLSCGVITLWWGMVVMTEWMDPCNIQYAKHVTRSHSSRAKGGWKSSSFLSSLVGLWSVRVNLNTITVMYANQLWLAILFWIAFWVNKMYPFMHNVVRKIILNLRVLLIRLVMISVMMRQQPFRTNLIERDGIHSLWLKKFVRDYNREKFCARGKNRHPKTHRLRNTLSLRMEFSGCILTRPHIVSCYAVHTQHSHNTLPFTGFLPQ